MYLFLADCIYGALSLASAAACTSFSVDNANVAILADCIYRTLSSTSAATDAELCIDLVCHEKAPPFKFYTVIVPHSREKSSGKS